MKTKEMQTVSDREVQILDDSTNLIEQAKRCEISSDTDYEKAGDLVKLLRGFYKKAEDDRKTLVNPLNGVVKEINQRYKKITNPIEKAGSDVKQLMLNYQQKLRKEAEEKAMREAEAAAKIAAQAKENGNEERAEEMEAESAAIIDSQIKKSEETVTARGNYGSTSSVKKIWTYEVTDIAKLASECPECVEVVNKHIMSKIRNGERNIAGLKVFQKEQVAVR